MRGRDILDTQDRMQKALNDADRREELLPRLHRGSPAIGIHGLRLIIRVNLVRFSFKLLVRLCELSFSRSWTDGGSEKTVLPHCRRNVHLFPGNPTMLFVRPQVSGEFRGMFDGGADHVVPSHMDFQTFDEHHILLKHPGSCPIRGPFGEEENLFGGVRIARHIGHHKGGANLPDFPVCFGHNPSHSNPLFDRLLGKSMEGPPIPYRLGKEFRIRLNVGVELGFVGYLLVE